MGDDTPTVDAGEVSESDAGDSATAQLAWSWPLGEQEWAYSAEATLRKVDGAWQVVWDPAVVEALRPIWRGPLSDVLADHPYLAREARLGGTSPRQ